MLNIEHHAVLYGLLAKEATQSSILARCALGKATAQYGKERGMRMSEYANQEGLERTMPAYSLFKEWRPLESGQMIPGNTIKQPSLITTVRRCEWVETWKKYGLLEYGKTYCIYVDKNLVKGFNPELELDIPALQSLGDPCCIFNWGYNQTPEIEADLADKREQIGEKYVRDFAFHTAHLYTCIKRVLIDHLGDEGRNICDRAVTEFINIFGESCWNAIQDTAQENNWV